MAGGQEAPVVRGEDLVALPGCGEAMRQGDVEAVGIDQRGVSGRSAGLWKTPVVKDGDRLRKAILKWISHEKRF